MLLGRGHLHLRFFCRLGALGVMTPVDEVVELLLPFVRGSLPFRQRTNSAVLISVMGLLVLPLRWISRYPSGAAAVAA